MQTFILTDCDSPVNMIYYTYLTHYKVYVHIWQYVCSLSDL